MKCHLRVSEDVWNRLATLIFRRYPNKEWGTFLECGWCAGKDGLVITLKGFHQPEPGDLDEGIAIFGVNERFTTRVALAAERSAFAVGVVHSHPEGFGCFPSELDDDMDDYFSSLFSTFAPDRPYVSVIFSKGKDGKLRFSGRCWWRGKRLLIEKVSIVGPALKRVWSDVVRRQAVPEFVARRLGRLAHGLGHDAAELLWNSSVAFVGVGGTGSPLLHSLARSCCRRVIIVDPEELDVTNSERIHGVREADLVGVAPSKVRIARRLVRGICSDIEVITVKGNALDPEVQRLLVEVDVIFGCTDSEHGRLLVSDLSNRFLIPAFQVNVKMERDGDRVGGEIVHLTQYGPGLPCAYCRGQVDAQLLAQELMDPKERAARKEAARLNPGGAYWKDEPVIATIGSLTTLAAELAANYGVGLLTERFQPPTSFLELNLLAPGLGVVSAEYGPLKSCSCSSREGGAGQVEQWISWLPRERNNRSV